MTQKTKSINYACAGSGRADHFDKGTAGCYYIVQTLSDIEGSGQCTSEIHPQANSEGFDCPDDPDLIDLFLECDGALCKQFLKYGDEKVLAALRARLVEREARQGKA